MRNRWKDRLSRWIRAAVPVDGDQGSWWYRLGRAPMGEGPQDRPAVVGRLEPAGQIRRGSHEEWGLGYPPPAA